MTFISINKTWIHTKVRIRIRKDFQWSSHFTWCHDATVGSTELIFSILTWLIINKTWITQKCIRIAIRVPILLYDVIRRIQRAIPVMDLITYQQNVNTQKCIRIHSTRWVLILGESSVRSTEPFQRLTAHDTKVHQNCSPSSHFA